MSALKLKLSVITWSQCLQQKPWSNPSSKVALKMMISYNVFQQILLAKAVNTGAISFKYDSIHLQIVRRGTQRWQDGIVKNQCLSCKVDCWEQQMVCCLESLWCWYPPFTSLSAAVWFQWGWDNLGRIGMWWSAFWWIIDTGFSKRHVIRK